MSPRRMDISSLLRDPSPPNDVPPRHTDRRSIDALLHHPNSPEPHPATIFSILSTPTRNSNHTPHTALPHTPPAVPNPIHPRPPFLGFDALVHVAAEERRRITALSDRDTPRFSPQGNPPARPSPLYDHDRPSTHYTYPPPSYLPSHRHPDHPFPHKRARDSPPRSPTPDSRFSQLSSPSSRHHSSASPINNYPALRRQPIIDPTPSRPTPLPVNDSRSIPFQRSPTLIHAHQPLQPLRHPSPRDNSPLYHSPQLLRSQRLSSPTQSTSFIFPSPESAVMSPRYTHGPKTAGGVELLSGDSPITSRPDLSHYQTPGRDMSVERLLSDSRLEHTRHELPKLSPLSAQAFPVDNDTYQPEPLPYQSEGQESVSLRDLLRSRPARLPLDTNNKYMAVQTSQPPTDYHPICFWEGQATVRETSQQHISPVHSLSIANLTEGHGDRSAKESRRIESLQDTTENVPILPLSTGKEPPYHNPVPAHLTINTPMPNSIGPRPVSPHPRSPIRQPNVPQILHQDSPVSFPPVLELHLENEREPRPKRFDTLVDASTSVLTSSGPIIAEPLLGKARQPPGFAGVDDTLVADSLLGQPSPQVSQPISVEEPGMSWSLATVSQSTSRSPSQRPLSIPSPVKDERNVSPEGAPISSLVPPKPPRRSPELENTSERISEQTMMDVEDELLSLVEDCPVPVVSTSSKAQAELKSQGNAVITRDGHHGPFDGPPLALSFQPVLKGHPLMTDEEKDRASMPPPAARSKKVEKDKTTPAGGSGAGSKKKKDGTSKPAAKPKQPPKPRAKPTPKAKAKPNIVDSSLKGSTLKSTVNVNARSRSTSVIPGAVEDIAPEPEVDNSEKEDDKLYCVCKTRYDEDRMMIACDRCDEWFHTLCVGMPDLEIDLVDQFICPPCIQKHPHLQTTWKRRCLFGLQHENPFSSEACHKPARGAFSKYCSDDCGIKFMQAHIAQWEKSGGQRDLLWDSVKNAQKREGVVVHAKINGASPRAMDVDGNNSTPKPLGDAARGRAEREVARLNARLEESVREHELMKHELDMVMWREKVVELASERAGRVDECGWDQRLCFGEEEWADFGPEVLESYEDTRVKMESEDDAMPLDSAYAVPGEWWCTGKKKCERHAGWQKLRAAEVSFDKETKEGILLKLTTREREIRKSIEDILYPQPTGALQVSSKLPHPKAQLNGAEKHHAESGKKRSP